MCKVFKVSRSGYYKWLCCKPSKRSVENNRLLYRIKAIYQESKQTYGSPRVTKALHRQGVPVSRPRVARLMRSARLRSIVRRKYVQTTDSNHTYTPAPNLLNQDFTAVQPGKVWVSDITYIKVASQWMYVTAILDLYDRRVVGWSMSSDMTAASTSMAALRIAITNGKPNGLLLHSDRGVQYACHEFRAFLASQKITQSMSRKGNCWDNAVAESFFKTLKVECTNRHNFASIAHARAELVSYIEGWYNTRRIHSSIDYQSPKEKIKTNEPNVA